MPTPAIREQPQAERGEEHSAEGVRRGPRRGDADGRFQAERAQTPKMSIEERRDLGVGQDPALLE